METKEQWRDSIEKLVSHGVLTNERKLRRLYQQNLKSLRDKLFFFQCEFFVKRGRCSRFVFIGLSVNLTAAWYDRKTKQAVYVPFYGGKLDTLFARSQKSPKIVNQYNWHAVSYKELCQLTFS